MKAKIIQFTAGRGPEECAWVVAKVLKIFLKEAEENQLGCTILHKEDGVQNTTVQSVTIQLRGEKVNDFAKTWIGTIQWIGASTFRKLHKRKNWFIGCFEIEQQQSLQLDENEVQFQAIRSSGPGGQHVNKVSSAVRATHIPTNIQVLVAESRSQHQNKKIALQRLQEKVADFNLKALEQSIKNQWENHLNLQRGNPVKIFEGSDFKSEQKAKSYKSKRNQLKNDLRKSMDV